MTNSFNMDANASHEEDLDIDALNDSQLYDKLRENNIVAGPIVDSTRDIYKKKLKKVLYGDEEESFAEGGDDGESELVSDKSRSWSEIVDEEEKEEELVMDGDLTGPVVENEGGEEVVDGVNGSQCETNSETEDDQPSGVSRPVETSDGLRKRVLGTNDEAKKENGVNVVDPKPETKTSPLVLVVAFLLALVAAVIIIIYFVTNDVPDVDAMQEAILEAANKAVGGEGGED